MREWTQKCVSQPAMRAKRSVEVTVLMKLPQPRPADPIRVLFYPAIKWPDDIESFAARLRTRRERNRRLASLHLVVADKDMRRFVAQAVTQLQAQLEAWLREEPERFTWPQNRGLPERLLLALRAACDEVPPKAWPALHRATKKFAEFTALSARIRFSLMTMRDNRDEILPL